MTECCNCDIIPILEFFFTASEYSVLDQLFVVLTDTGCVLNLCVYTHVCVCIHMYVCVCVCVCVYIYTHTHTYYIYIYM